MKQQHTPKNRLISFVLCAVMLLGLLPPLALRVAAESYNGVVAASDKDYGPVNVVPSALKYNSSFMSSYVTNGGRLSLNGKFRLVDSQNYNKASDHLPSGTIEGKKPKMWYASYKLNLTDAERKFLNEKTNIYFQSNLVPDEHSHGVNLGLINTKKWHWSNVDISLSGPNAEGGNSWRYMLNGRNGDPGYVQLDAWGSTEKNDGQPQPVSASWGEVPYDGDLYFNAYQLWNRDCGDTEVRGTVFYAAAGGNPWISDVRLTYPNGGSVNAVGSLSQDTTDLMLEMDISTGFRFADNKTHDLSGVKVYLDAEYLDQSDSTGGFKIPATFDHMTKDKLVFKLQVKKSWKHFKITGVSGTNCGLNKKTDLVLWDHKGNALDAVKLYSDTYFSDFYGSPMGEFTGMRFSRSGYVFDCVAPELEKVDMAGGGTPANAGVPDSWLSNSGSNSSIFAGTGTEDSQTGEAIAKGDTYSFWLIFSEDITVDYQNNARAVLSITEGSSPIKLKIKSVDGNKVAFEELEIKDSMLSPGELIHIEKLENFTIRDKVGNPLTITDLAKKPAQQILLDVDKPYTDTTATTQGDVYEAYADSASAYRFSFPVKFLDVSAAGVRNSGISGTKMSFRLEMADGTTDLPYRWYMDTKQQIRSDATWQPGVTGGKIVQEDISEGQVYWIHVELEKGVDYHYTLDEDGIWFNGKLTFDGLRDWAGNVGSAKSYALRHQVDREGPSVSFASSLSMKTSYLENNDLQLDFSIKFSGADNYALNSLYYQWETTNENGEYIPVGDGFTVIDVANGMNREESREITFRKTVDSNNKGKLRVKVYAQDHMGFVSEVITSDPVSWVFGGIKNHSYVNENDIFSPSKYPSFVMALPTTEGITPNAPSALLVIPDVDSRDENGEYTEFWIWGSHTESHLSHVNRYNPFREYLEWVDSGYEYSSVPGYLGKVTGSIDVETAEGRFTQMLQLNTGSDELTEELVAARKEFCDYVANYYGSMELYTVATYSITSDFEDVNFKSAESALNTYKVYLANDPTYDVEWTIVNAQGQTDAQAEAAGGVKLDYDGGYPATSLDNASAILKITNVKDAESKNGVKYGLDFINFDEGNAAFELYYTDSSRYGQDSDYEAITRYTDRTPIKTWDLVRSADGVNTVVLEPGLCDQNGWYTLAFKYQNTYTGQTEKMILGAFYMDATTLDITIRDYHKAVSWNGDEDENAEEGFVWKLYDIEERNANDEEIQLGLAPLPEGWSYGDVFDVTESDWYEGSELTFYSTKRPSGDTANQITDDLAAVRVYNVTYNAQAGLEKDTSAGWSATTDAPSQLAVVHSYLPYLADVNAEQPYGVVDGNNMLPFVDGANLLVYEIRASNGMVTSHEIIIHVAGRATEWQLDYSVSRNEETGMPIGITVRPVDAQGFPLDLNGSQEGADLEAYDATRYNFREHSRYNDDFATEYVYDKSVVDLTYMLIDPLGNVSDRTLTVYDEDGETVLFIDSNEPDYSQFYICSDPECGTENVTDQMYNLTNEFDADSYHLMVSSEDWLDWDGTHYGSAIDPESLTLYFDAEYSQILEGERDEYGRVFMSVPFARDKDGNLLMNEDGTYAIWEDMVNPINGIYRTQIRELTEAKIEVAIWGVWKGCDDPTLNLSGNRTISISAADVYGNRQSTTAYGSDSFEPSVVENGYSFGVGSIAHDVGFVDGWSGESFVTRDTIAVNVPDDEGVLGIYSTVPFANISGWGVDVDDVVEVLVTMDGNHNGYDEYGTEYVSAGRYYFYPAPMITQDGTYYFSVTDLFGVSYDQEPGTVTEEQSAMFHEQIPVEVNVFGELGIQVDFSTTSPTNETVTVYAEATGEYECLRSITADDGTVGVIDPDYPKSGYITVAENAVITIVAEDEWGDETNRRNVKVTNIDKVLEDAAIFYYDQSYNVLNPEIGATEVTAVLVCDEPVFTTNGPDKYTFPSGSVAGTTYTFEYQDEAGNTGSITAVLPIDLGYPEIPEDYVDTAAPELEAGLYGYANGRYDLLNRMRNPETVDGESELTAPVNAIPGFKIQKARVTLNVTDESEVKILVTEAGAAAPTDFAAVQSGSSVPGITMTAAATSAALEITENTVFDIHVIDSNNNVSSFPAVTISCIDLTAPVLTPVYEPGVDADGISTVIATFEPSEEDKFEEITPLSADVSSKLVLVDGTYVLRYYHIFQENGTYSFTYTDSIGNTGTALAQVKGLSTEAPVVKSISWFGTAPAGHVSLSPDRSTPVNRDITAQLSMSKAIRDVELFVYDPAAEGQMGAPVPASSPVSVSFTADTIDITYTDNVDDRIVVRFTASETGRKGTYILPVVNCIDKTAPVVTLKSTALSSNKRALTFTFETSKPTVLNQNSGEAHTKGFQTTHTWVATDNKPVKLTFVDQTGNQTVYAVTDFPGLDTLRLAVSYSPASDGTGATEDPANDLQLYGGSHFYIRVNKDATAVINNGTGIRLTANVWTKLETPTAPGFHILKLTDSNTGETLTELIRALPKDNLAPVMEFDSSTIHVWQNASQEALTAAVRKGVTIHDNVDTDLDFTVTGCPDSAAQSGVFTLRYSTQDAAGNRTAAERTLYILDENTPILWINGEAGLPHGKIFLNAGTMNLTLENMDQDEGTVIKFRKGLHTTGQMKYDATTVEGMSFEVTENGHYTIYVRTQDRTEFVTYIYVEG